jgi:hypothetical protein
MALKLLWKVNNFRKQEKVRPMAQTARTCRRGNKFCRTPVSSIQGPYTTLHRLIDTVDNAKQQTKAQS